MRIWAAGQGALGLDALLVAAAGYAASPAASHDMQARLLLVAGAIVGFLIPAVLAVQLPTARLRTWFWLAASLPALAWVPAMPWVFLRAGPPLGSPSGLALAGLGLVAAVVTLVCGALAALEVRSGRPDL
jgi:hypothetical protein